MKQRLRAIAAGMLVWLFVLCTVAPAHAGQSVSMQLPVTVLAEGALPTPQEGYTLRLLPDASGNPMPNGQTGGSFDLQMKAPGEALLPTIMYKTVGVYTYTLRQVPGTHPDCTYDSRVYAVVVSVTNAEPEGYGITVTLREEGEPTKPDKAVFHNVYIKAAPQPTPGTPNPPGPLVPTGVADNWMGYLAGSILLFAVSGWLIYLLRRKEDGPNG